MTCESYLLQDANSELEKKLKEARPYQLMSELKQQQQQQQQQQQPQLQSSLPFNLSTIAETPLHLSTVDGDFPFRCRTHVVINCLFVSLLNHRIISCFKALLTNEF